jgi:hypothetical protein
MKRHSLPEGTDPETDPTRQGDLSTIPEQSWGDIAVAVMLFVGSCLYLLRVCSYTTLFHDEGIVLQGAQRILQGQVLYRDFFAFITPGSYYWMALLFRVFGSSILVARAALVIYGALFSVLTYLISRRVCSRWVSSIAASLVTITCVPYYFIAVHNWDSTLWAYFAIYCAIRLLESRHWTWAALMGSFAAFTCLSEQSKGGGLVLGATLGLVVVFWRGNARATLKGSPWGGLFAGFAWPFVATMLYFGFQHGLVQMLAAWFWPFQHYSAVNRAFYGQFELTAGDVHALLSGSWALRLIAVFAIAPCFLVPALPVLAVGTLAIGIHRLRRRGRLSETWRYYVVVSAMLVGLLLATLATGRPDLIHLMFEAPMFFLVLAWGMGGRDLPSPHFKGLEPITISLVVVSFAAFGIALLWAPLNAHHRLETRRGVLITRERDGALEEVLSQIPAGTSTFVYPNDPLYYYLTATKNPTAFDELYPGSTTPAQFRTAINEIQADRTPVIILETDFLAKLPASRSSMPLSFLVSKDFDAEYIFAEYKVCRTLRSALQHSTFVLLARRDLTCGGPY